MNAAAGMLSIMFKIKGPLSVISTNNGAIDGIQYAKEMMRNNQLEYVLLVSANQWIDMGFMCLEQFGYDSTEYIGAGLLFSSSAFLSANGESSDYSRK